ncbi:MAG TPA: cobalamin-independent methionine synthase II family protein [Verrucomicrobiae bacterium]|jgi:5-methyltetrahydropteroyltriglutamate--homocysteine methyltransferase|nr:cobalamin-independent methionine synthase II family protein [Verrucomicrobiae bacterium]
MKHSRERILVTHAGSLPRPPDLWEMLTAKANGQSYDRAIFADCLRRSVAEVVRKQIDSGIDVVNDGEFGKHSFSDYAQERLGGWVERPVDPAERPPAIFGRDLAEFPEYFAAKGGRAVVGRHASRIFCCAPLTYIGQTALKTDIENFKTALAGARVEEAFLPAVAPGTIEHRIKNDYYPSDEAYLQAVAEAMHEEYKAIVDAGFILQIDDPDLADGWQLNAHLTLAEYRKFAALRIDALNHALSGIPEDRVRFHMCWGSYHGPHKYDIPLRDIVDLILRVRAEVYSIEASNPCHEHEWRVWEEAKLPEGKALIPGVTGHYSDFIEHPEAIADRLVKYARLVGRENVMAGTDCGLGTRVGHPKITWAKFEAMRDGARIATRRLWGH